MTYSVVVISSPDGVMTKTVTNTSSFNFIGLMPDNRYEVSVAYGTHAGVGEAELMILNIPTVEDAIPKGDYCEYIIMYVFMWSSVYKHGVSND